jgi:hypothetical protein
MASIYVLIVEDEPLIGMAMSALVVEAGGEPHGPFMTLKDALDAAHTAEPLHCALLDCNLGPDSSWPVADVLAKRGVAFAFTSGGAQIEPRFAGRPVFTKPIDEEKVKAFIQQHRR